LRQHLGPQVRPERANSTLKPVLEHGNTISPQRLRIYDKSDRIWFAGAIVGTDLEFAKKVADLDTSKTLPVY
jgi:hypothetical protein